jgi:hypothetical protein
MGILMRSSADNDRVSKGNARKTCTYMSSLCPGTGRALQCPACGWKSEAVDMDAARDPTANRDFVVGALDSVDPDPWMLSQ